MHQGNMESTHPPHPTHQDIYTSNLVAGCKSHLQPCHRCGKTVRRMSHHWLRIMPGPALQDDLSSATIPWDCLYCMHCMKLVLLGQVTIVEM